MAVLSILLTKGNYNNMLTLSTIVTGAIVDDYEVKIFAMDDAVWAFKKDAIGTDLEIHSHNPAFKSALEAAQKKEGMIVPWWDMLEDLKDMGEITITLCSLMCDIAELKKEDFSDLVDKLAGVGSFMGDLYDADKVISI